MDLVAELSDRLLFAIPKKGRLHQKCLDLLENIDVQFNRKPRHDIALSSNLPIAILFLPASDIAKYVADGDVDLGITGQDIIVESEASDKVNELLSLGFGKCLLQVQAPVRNAQIIKAEDLIGKRIVTSFPVLAAKYFKELESTKGDTLLTQINFVSGSVEAACSLGLAQGIVDLVESGETMRAAGLHPVGTIMKSEAVLISNTKTSHPDLIKKLKSRMEGALLAKKYVICTYNISRDKLADATAVTPGRKAPSVSPLESSGWVAVTVMILKADEATIMDKLKEIGAEDIMVTHMVNCRA
ncbi:ATP phosphoribosyltransferase (ATP-PRTase) (ATP-PRT) [Entomophthora muscae]|uniref:ATP phosphoribosyltransferase (ATP-PRTase) (ATP-PRT) n=1 Tax=Entomophthora muscae TaxID=34485 RepID=A0ACC2RTX4_9FUNG|nr:ATP phosphoribosyltransferase (ATP-PRTase) (ATP-PRT) [Entomophthora muscae]